MAAVLLEPIQGEAGVIAPSSDYLGGVRELCTERGILLMVDEIQTGLGRTGRWFAFQHTGIEPDVVTMAKALGNGVPIGACWARAEVAAAFSPGDHGSTFGGQPLAAAAARATWPSWRPRTSRPGPRRAGARLRAGLVGARRRRPACGGPGSCSGAALDHDRRQGRGHGAALARGLVVNAPRADTIRLAPSLLVSDERDRRGAVDCSRRALADVAATTPRTATAAS